MNGCGSSSSAAQGALRAARQELLDPSKAWWGGRRGRLADRPRYSISVSLGVVPLVLPRRGSPSTIRSRGWLRSTRSFRTASAPTKLATRRIRTRAWMKPGYCVAPACTSELHPVADQVPHAPSMTPVAMEHRHRLADVLGHVDEVDYHTVRSTAALARSSRVWAPSTSATHPGAQPAPSRRSSPGGVPADAAASARHRRPPRPDRRPPPGCVDRGVLAGACASTPGPVGAAPVRARSHSSAGLRAMRGRLWHQRRPPRPPHTAPGRGERRCEPRLASLNSPATAGSCWAPHRHGGRVGPCDLDRWWHPTRPRRHVPRSSSSLLRPSQRHLPSQGTVPKTPRECPGGGGDDRASGRRDQAGLAARKRRVGAVRGAVPAQNEPKSDRPRAKTPMNRRKSRLRRRAAPLAASPTAAERTARCSTGVRRAPKNSSAMARSCSSHCSASSADLGAGARASNSSARRRAGAQVDGNVAKIDLAARGVDGTLVHFNAPSWAVRAVMSSTTLPVCPKTGSTSPSLTVHLCLHTVPGNRECALPDRQTVRQTASDTRFARTSGRRRQPIATATGR